MELLRTLLYGVSAQRPSHSIFLAGEQLPLEARMGGIFLGFLCGLTLLVVLGRLRASQPPGGVLAVACWALIALTGLDGLNAFLFDGSLPHLYPPLTALRLLTGLGAGLAVAVMAVPVVADRVWARPGQNASHILPATPASLELPARPDSPASQDLLASIESPVELGAGLALAGLVGGLVLASAGALLWPVTLAMLAGVVAAFGVANLYLLVLVTGRVHQAVTLVDLRGGLISSLGCCLLELAGLAALRSLLVAAFGVTWGI